MKSVDGPQLNGGGLPATRHSLVWMPSRNMGGAEKLAGNFARTLVAGGGHVQYVTRYSDENASWRAALKEEEIQVENEALEGAEEDRSVVGFVLQVLRSWLLLRRLRPGRVFVYLPWPTVGLATIAALALRKLPTLLIFQLVPPTFLLGRRHAQLLRWAVKRGRIRCVAVCRQNRDLLAKLMGLPEDKIDVVYNGTPRRGAVLGQTESARQALADWRLADASPLLCSAGRVCSQKGFDLMVSVLPHLRDEFPGLRWLILGSLENPYAHELVARLRERGVDDLVRFPGAVSDVQSLIASGQIFLFPSRFEGHSLALTEAMAAGLAIVASDASGIAEVVRPGREGVIFRDGDSCDLLEKLRWALRNPKEMARMGVAAQLRQQDYTEEQMIAGTRAAMQKVEGGPA